MFLQCLLLAFQLCKGVGNTLAQFLQLPEGIPILAQEVVARFKKIPLVAHGSRHGMRALLVQQHFDLPLLTHLPGGFQFHGNSCLL